MMRARMCSIHNVALYTWLAALYLRLPAATLANGAAASTVSAAAAATPPAEAEAWPAHPTWAPTFDMVRHET